MSPVGLQDVNSGSPGSGCYAPARPSAPFPDGAWVPAGTVSFRILNHGPTSHEFILVRTDLAPDKLTLQDDGLTVDEEARGIDLLDEAGGLDIDERQTLVLDLTAGNYVMYCNLEGHYLGGMHAELTAR